jgi:hypothetical protein
VSILKMNQTTWQVLVENYAMRTREFSDAVAVLGRANLPPAKCVKLLETVNARRESCMAAADKVHQYLEQHAPAAKCAAASAQSMNCSEE